MGLGRWLSESESYLIEQLSTNFPRKSSEKERDAGRGQLLHSLHLKLKNHLLLSLGFNLKGKEQLSILRIYLSGVNKRFLVNIACLTFNLLPLSPSKGIYEFLENCFFISLKTTLGILTRVIRVQHGKGGKGRFVSRQI